MAGNPRDNWAEGWQVGNSWQGEFPAKNSLKDGYAGLSPTTAFPPNSLGVRLVFLSIRVRYSKDIYNLSTCIEKGYPGNSGKSKEHGMVCIARGRVHENVFGPSVLCLTILCPNLNPLPARLIAQI